jgi:hypothetical protein
LSKAGVRKNTNHLRTESGDVDSGENVLTAASCREEKGKTIMASYYIVCKRHMFKRDHAVLFWGPNRQGYRYNLNEAGIYSEEEAATFDKEHYNHDIPVQRGIADMCAIESVIDNRTLGRICRNTKSNRSLFNIKLTELHKGETNWDARAFCEPKRFLNLHENTLQLISKIKEAHP